MIRLSEQIEDDNSDGNGSSNNSNSVTKIELIQKALLYLDNSVSYNSNNEVREVELSVE